MSSAMTVNRKLSLNKETLRNLSEPDLQMVAGGISGAACLLTEMIGLSFNFSCSDCGGGGGSEVNTSFYTGGTMSA